MKLLRIVYQDLNSWFEQLMEQISTSQLNIFALEHFNSFQSNIAFHMETSYLIFSKTECFAKIVDGFQPLNIFIKKLHFTVNQETGFYMDCDTEMECVKADNNYDTKIMNEIVQSREVNSNCQLQT